MENNTPTTIVKIVFRKKDISIPFETLMQGATDYSIDRTIDLDVINVKFKVEWYKRLVIMERAWQEGANIISFDKPYTLPF